MLARTWSAAVVGVDGAPVRVEVDVAFGLPGLTIVGLAGSAVLEARERIRSALRNCGFELPARRITVNLAPADAPKDGTAFDLAMAVGTLVASGQLAPEEAERTGLVGELALDGGLRPVPGALSLAAALRDAGVVALVAPEANAAEAALVEGIRVHAAPTLGDAVAHLAGARRLRRASAPEPTPVASTVGGDLREVRGQLLARRALEIVAAGRHSLALVGPPGVGKTLLLGCLPGLLPPLTDGEAIEVSRIHSVAGLLDRRAPLVRTRPFRAPHHTVSSQALVGGGPRIRPGEASLAHRGALLLDETLQFRADALEALRQPLESGRVTIARVDGAVTMPARFMLLAAYNPCPCGWWGSRARTCVCDEPLRRRHAARLSGPLRDRIDLHVTMDALTPPTTAPEPSAAVAERVAAAWARQLRRHGAANGDLDAGGEPRLGDRVRGELEARAARFGLSPRRVARTARVARTIADLAGAAEVAGEHVAEALRYRPAEVAP